MNSMKTYLILWLSGLIAGVIIMERWRRTGRGLITPAARAGEAVETPSASPASKVSGDKPRVSAVLVAGAKADAVRVHYFVKRVTPWVSTPVPAPAQLRRWSRAATPGNTPDPSA